MPDSPKPEPALLKAASFDVADIGSCDWDQEHKSDLLVVSDDGRTMQWGRGSGKGRLPPAWVGAMTRLHLHSGNYRWDFVVRSMGKAQIGIGFMLLWNLGPDWGFFGYLGSSSTAFAYDPSTGDVVCNTASIEGGLPRFSDGESGVVSVHLDLPRLGGGSARFLVDDKYSRSIELPVGAVVLPAACFLKEGQTVTLAGFHRS